METITDSDFELDLTFLPQGAAVGALMNSTSDGCGSTSQSACVTCIHD
ncbi:MULTISPECIES: FxLD family lanthipeptide [Saccharopolyspora]|uniref:FxLD family lanthipeptide n=1 Tax=Saccharopolyspora cebuensis TaxID=418759 RepID=A0ABV4CM79_9PSEU